MEWPGGKGPARLHRYGACATMTAMSGGTMIGRCVLGAWLVLAAAPAMAGYRFEDGVELGPAALLADWSGTLERHEAQRPAIETCLRSLSDCPRHFRGVHLLFNRAGALEEDARIRVVNHFINRRPYRNDRPIELESRLTGEVVRLRSRWSTLSEFLERGGDCQDYAVAKYHLLRLLGFPSHALRVVVTWDRASRAHHALLAVRRADGSVWLLDSDNTIYRTRPFGMRYVYAINETGVWDHEIDASSWEARLQQEEST
jgi:predicted transglutaminase-like cysteine proteinase